MKKFLKIGFTFPLFNNIITLTTSREVKYGK